VTYPPEYGPPPRVTAYWYVCNRGLMAKYGTLEWLGFIGYRAAGEARWLGIGEQKVWEGAGQNWLLVHTWPEDLWARVIATLEREEKTAFADAATSQDDDGQAAWERNEAAAQDVTAYPAPQGEQAGWDIGY
jgi:hypothetical protein